MNNSKQPAKITQNKKPQPVDMLINFNDRIGPTAAATVKRMFSSFNESIAANAMMSIDLRGFILFT